MTTVDPAHAAPAPQDISGLVTGVMIRVVRAAAGDDGVAEVLHRAGEHRSAEELEDPRAWSSHEQALALFRSSSEVLSDPDLARHVGEQMLRQYDGTDVAELLRSLGSPAELLRNITAAAAKFSTVSTLEPLEVGDAHAVVQAVTRTGAVRHLDLCEFTKGMLSQAPVLFGLLPAVVTETECQARGGRFCLYSLAWEARQWSSFVGERASLYTTAWADQGVVEAAPEVAEDPAARIAQLEDRLAQMSKRLEQMFSSASDLLAGDDLDELLRRITERAADAVNAPRYLLVVRTGPGQAVHLHHHGFEAAEAAALADELWRPNPDDADGSRLIADIASPRRFYGRLAAVYPPGMRFMARERQIFSLYANYAATALDLVTALAESRRSNATARALLDFARALAHVNSVDEVAQRLAETVPQVAGCDHASVLLWDPDVERLVLRAVSGSGGVPGLADILADQAPEWVGFDPERSLAEAMRLSTDDTPLVGQLRSSRAITVLERGHVDELVGFMLDVIGSAVSVVSPLYADGQFLGIVTADFRQPPTVDPREDWDLHERLAALSDQTVTAIRNVRLLEQVSHLAWHDALTGLPNRRLLQDRVDQELQRSRRTGEGLALFFVDLDRFKEVNDSLGHRAGDELIRQVAGRLLLAVRRQDTVARLGGDEFAILLPGLAERADVEQLAERMLVSLHQPYQVEGETVGGSGSIGVALSPLHGSSYDELLNHADEAMYRAKSLGRNTFQVYAADEGPVAGSAELGPQLAEAIDSQLFLLYQPYIDLQTEQMAGVEALVRWRHPERGVLEPGAFLPVAEETGLIVALDDWVLHEACRQLRAWADDGVAPPRMAVNVTGQDLLAPTFAESVRRALADNDLRPEQLELEIPQHITPDAAGVMRATVDTLRADGVRFSVDDFDTGASSLSNATAFPVTTLKIDRSFVQILGPSDALNSLVSAIVAMTEQLGLDCVAEGVETSGQSRVLLQRGCTTAQGFFFSPPLFPLDVERLLRGDNPPVGGSPVAAAAGDHWGTGIPPGGADQG